MSLRFYALLLLAVLGTAPCCINTAHAQPPPVDHQLEALTLARLCVHEAGFDSPDDCTGIYAVLARGSARRHLSLIAYARTYSPRFFAGTSARPWARLLVDADEAPRGLAASWRHPRAEGALSRRDAFAVLLEHCRGLVAAPPAYIADDWGTLLDHERAARAGRRFRFVPIGSARNLFSVRLGRIAPRASGARPGASAAPEVR